MSLRRGKAHFSELKKTVGLGLVYLDTHMLENTDLINNLGQNSQKEVLEMGYRVQKSWSTHPSLPSQLRGHQSHQHGTT